tara:strand:- start:10 stop:564 length:555 start_codon:yes stop_codon:yes gene_type:complete
MKSPFNKDDYNSSDGMLTSVWGPSMWHSLHTISFNYPVNPTEKDKKKYYNFFKSLQHILPCKYCRMNYKKNIKKVPLNKAVMKNRYTFSKWVYDLHEEINRMLCKKSNLTFSQVQQRYENFRSRCIDNKLKLVKKKKSLKRKKKESGCVVPLYGKKSKCVINIVPKDTKCKTFNIDKQCIIKAL